MPSPEAAYPWLIALAATSLFSGLGIARRLRGAGAIRRRRFIDGALIGTALTVLSATIFASAALANAAAIRETVPTASRYGPTDPTGPAAALRRPAGGRPDRDPRRDARWRGRPALDRLDRPRRRPRRHRLPLERLCRDRPRARGLRGDPARPRGMGPEPGPAVGHRRSRGGRPAERRPPGARDGAGRVQPGDGRGSRRRRHRRRPRAALRGGRRRDDVPGGVPAGPDGWSAMPTSIAGAASWTTGSSWTASSAR